MNSTRSKKVNTKRSREAGIMSDLENGNSHYDQIERDLGQMTKAFQTILIKNKTRTTPLLEKTHQENEIRNMLQNRNPETLK